MNEELDRVQLTLAQAEAKVVKADKWEKLLANPLFEELVTKDYLGDDAVRLTMNMKPKSEDNEVVSNMLIAKSTLSRFVGNVLEEGRNAKMSIEENAALLAEMDNE